MKILNFYFLDRNAIGTIEAILRGKALNDEEWRTRKKRLKAIDKKKNFVAALLSSVEGANSFNETPENKETTMLKEANLVKSFFKLAQKDAKANTNLANAMSQLSLGKHEHGFKNYIEFYKESSPILSQTISSKKYSEKEKEIISIAKKHNVSTVHPVFLCALSVMYGNEHAREVLKFKQNPTNENAYNALSDILLISRIPNLAYILRTGNFKECKIKLVTFDKNLKKIYDYFIFKTVKVSENDMNSVAIDINVDLNPEIFTALSKEEVLDLIERMKSVQSSTTSILAHPVMGAGRHSSG